MFSPEIRDHNWHRPIGNRHIRVDIDVWYGFYPCSDKTSNWRQASCGIAKTSSYDMARSSQLAAKMEWTA